MSYSNTHPSVIVNLLKQFHCKMGYPLGRLHAKVRWLTEKLQEIGTPLRHVRRIVYTATHPAELLKRRFQASKFTENMSREISERAKQLRQEGFAYFTDQINPELMNELCAHYENVISARSASAVAPATHPFFFSLLKPEDLTMDSIFVRFALQESILQVVTAYFGSVPYLSGIDLTESRDVKIGNTSLLGSRQWHLDYTIGGGDQVAVWVYLSDVTGPDQGPFTYLPIPASRKVRNDFFPRRIRDEEIEADGLAVHVKQACGPRSTAFLVNTLKCYHMGSRMDNGQKRVVCCFYYSHATKQQNRIRVLDTTPERDKLVLSH